ncbi:acyl-CoA hydrolase [Paraburkholderia sp. WC7.3g]|uniref:Acetyl-CoA hydrolase n=1 Tax=Paraburkholderia podalyriae TaxID=1938811 RepID=A0ABR7PHW9_9BURK|nr:acetyl-CoA hydrolase [Paraburkholderia podalyriae]
MTTEPVEIPLNQYRSLQNLSAIIRPGDTVLWGQAHAEPVTLIRALVQQRAAFGRLRLFIGIGVAGILQPEHADAFDFLSYCGTGENRKLAEAGVLDFLPVHYSQLPRMICSGQLHADVVFLQVSKPDALGRYSLGLAREYVSEAVRHARSIVGEVHPDVPWTYGGPYLRDHDFALLVDSTSPLPISARPLPNPVETEIGRHVAGLIEDGATLQTGIGSIQDAVLTHLKDHRELGVHSGSIGEGIACLCEAGVVTNSCKSIDAGLTIGGTLIGGAPLHRFAHLNSSLELRGTEYTHDPSVLAGIERFVAINSAIEVDVTGQVNAEVAGGSYVGGVGGIGDFLRAAQTSRGGVPIIALPSAAGIRSGVVASLSGPVTVPRSDACVIVTEHGIADLRGLSIAQRIPRMLAIADPLHREALEREVHALMKHA